jgi:hypothetical protein
LELEESRPEIIVHPSFTPAIIGVLTAFDNRFQFLEFPYPTDETPNGWLQAIGKSRPPPAVMCLSTILRRNAVGRQAIKESGCVFLCLAPAWQQLSWADQCAKIIRSWSGIARLLKETSPPALIDIPVNGNPYRSTI